jgi:hypothetical protein
MMLPKITHLSSSLHLSSEKSINKLTRGKTNYLAVFFYLLVDLQQEFPLRGILSTSFLAQLDG